tara:strand:+ start:1331 stop:1684 length:354 start_codon:yes stop_codon:yes gene_type:complete
MNIALDDKKVCQVKMLIQQKNDKLESKLRELKNTQENNKFLSTVVDDYIKYFKYIRDKKTEQYNALRKITDYIDRISETSDMTEYLLRESKNDQKDIIKRMEDIKAKIDSITTIIDS